ncbi:adenosine receptor A3-like [Oculina patagonica]
MEGISRSRCSATSTYNYLAAQQFPNTIYIFACVFSVVCSVLSSFGNTMILFALRKCQSLHSPSKALLCSLALTDLFVGLVVLPLYITYNLMIILEMPRHYCVIAITYGRTSTFIAGVSLENIATIAIDRYLAFHLRSRYRELVTLKRVVCILVFEWILATVWSGSWFLNGQNNFIFKAIVVFTCCLITSFSYFSYYCGVHRYVAQIRQEQNPSEPAVGFNVVQYKKTVNNMLWINGLLLVCYMPYFLSLLAILSMGLNNSTRFALQFSAIAIYLNSVLNPVLYCWKIKELREKVIAILRALYNFISSHVQ